MLSRLADNPAATAGATTGAESVSRVVLELAAGAGRGGRVLGVHSKACNIELAPAAGELAAPVVTLTGRKTGNGPLNIVVEDFAAVHAVASTGTASYLDRNRLSVGPLAVLLQGAVPWEPCPGWDRLRSGRGPCRRRLDSLLRLARRRVPPGTLLDLLPPSRSAHWPGAMGPRLHAAFTAIFERIEADGLPAAAVSLAGLGNGLTPAGDDFLLGAMLAIWLRSTRAAAICGPLARAAARRTSSLSASLLHQAAAGHCGADWHAFLQGVAGDDDVTLERSTAALLAHGHTSGGDALAGFLWACRHERPPG